MQTSVAFAVVATVLAMLGGRAQASFVYNVLKHEFFKDFENSCSKYPFVQEYIDRLTRPSEKQVVFVFQQNYLRNGGFGDRIAGLINAAGMAMRFNRTLIIRSANNFHKLYRPYITPAMEARGEEELYTYGELSGWTRYNKSYENNDNTELDLYDCINVPGRFADRCSQIWGEPQQPIILLRGNRAYLCRWWNCPEHAAANRELLRAVGGKQNDDLMEVAGCLLRLAMWPTDLLWSYINEAFESHKLDLKRRGLVQHHDQALLWRYVVSMHFRCGDLGYLRGQAYELSCQHTVAKNVTYANGSWEMTYNIPPHQESSYMGYGTPLDLADCAQHVLTNMTELAATGWHSFHAHDHDYDHDQASSQRRLQQQNQQRQRRLLRRQLQADAASAAINSTTQLELEYRTIVHIASDNAGSANQINDTLLWPNTLMSPSGCHIEMDSSFECLRLTATYWMVMAHSDVVITPSTHGVPNSGFSKYAAVYGLKGDSLRDPKECSTIFPRKVLSHTQHGNWNCIN